MSDWLGADPARPHIAVRPHVCRRDSSVTGQIPTLLLERLVRDAVVVSTEGLHVPGYAIRDFGVDIGHQPIDNRALLLPAP